MPDINTSNRKDFFWLTVSEGSVHGCLAPGALSRASWLWKLVVEELPHLMANGKQRQEVTRSKIPLEAYHKNPFPPARIHLLKFP
jgi:hypothetical protein